MRRSTIVFLALLACLVLGRRAGATSYDVVASVTVVEESSVPDLVSFQLSAGAGGCGTSTSPWFIWDGSNVANHEASVQSVASALLATMLSGRQVHCFFDDTCTAHHIHCE